MNDPLNDIAAELERLRPSDPGEGLTRRIEAALEARSQRARGTVVLWPWAFRWAALAAALAVIVAVAVMVSRKPASDAGARGPAMASMAEQSDRMPPEPAPPFRRVNRGDYLLDAEDGGLIYTSAGTPWRKVTCEYVSASEWRDERARMTFQVLVPRRETVVIPVPID
ncbi:MAG TPA: hypothetical protein PKM73_02305 [Verrucomicrobiota bacterium]|nr:hypothetical protein [Verrucomicrobiota bacterium]HNU49746.1 hypothetical protein [Verrucomicrobiota bacterium]